MELYKYTGIRQCTYDELDEFVKRVIGSLISYLPTNRIAAVYHEMGTEQVTMDGVSEEGSSWAMEDMHRGS